ncbi:hypothetical protein ACVVIH_19785 [Chryseobacterium arthrosphaerae]|uniref:hypothetical protein n=1 Tax=Chryseobacterium arthrosphaerae TaxID=651561 RepID=UPI003D356796
MRKLTGMKNFSSLENKRLKNLQTISGGSASNRSAGSEYNSPDGRVVDTDYYTDDAGGQWSYKGRTTLLVGPAKPTEAF